MKNALRRIFSVKKYFYTIWGLSKTTKWDSIIINTENMEGVGQNLKNGDIEIVCGDSMSHWIKLKKLKFRYGIDNRDDELEKIIEYISVFKNRGKENKGGM